ncbi:MAG: acyl-CoA dehydrogenase family protein [Acidobacteria bacterium]|nr:acyl-CoA dehydrogenase family protein [Acidobacteriota bacterium]MCA1611153.1 acyl-CoA dehydrogenase family protein [Acidobacteriota bacterium]
MTTTQVAERDAILQSVREFADAEIRPHVMEWDEAQHFPLDVFRQLGELGFLGVLFPEEYGGSALSYGDYAAIVEELAAVDASIALSLAAHNSLGSNHIFQFGSEAQRRRYIPKLASGEWLAAWGLTEPEAGSDASGTKTTGVRDGNDWVLNGSKNFITNASVAQVAVLMAVTDRPAGKHGISAFIVELDNPGIRVGKKENKLGMRASDTCTLVMEDCRIPAENLLGKEGGGFVDSMKILDGGRISIAALSIGIARGAYEASLRYAQQRRQFGRPISEFEAIQFYLADMATEIDAARLLTMRAAAAKDSGEEVTRFSAQAKLYASEVAVRATEKAIQIHGGYGFIKDYPVEKFYRDVKLCTIGEGTSEIQRLVIARSLLGS